MRRDFIVWDMSNKVEQQEWWQEAFQAEYLAIYSHRDDSSALAEAAGVSEKIKHLSGKVLDACCGNGRHAAALRDLGFDIFAFDYSKDLLLVAHERGQIAQRLFQADIRYLPFNHQFSAITLFFTAFGYFNDEQNQLVLADLSAALEAGGLLMLDLPDPDKIRSGLVPSSEKETESGLFIEEQRRMDGNYVVKDVKISAAGVLKRSYSERVRLYEHDELIGFAAKVGLDFDMCWPSLIGPEIDQGRRVYWFKKPTT
jgi:SAM-dependent methyltransferase